MPTPPTQSRLIIPGKEDPQAHPRYPDDMRAIEIWANARGLKAGSGVTITNPNGPVSTITATGGTGANVGLLNLIGGADAFYIPGFVIPGFNQSQSPFIGESLFALYDPSTVTIGSAGEQWVGFNYFSAIGATAAVVLLPQVNMPTWTLAANIPVTAWMFAANLAWTQYFVVQSVVHNFASGASYQFTAADFTGGTTWSNLGADLVITAGSGQNGNGLVTTAGGIFFAACQLRCQVPSGINFK